MHYKNHRSNIRHCFHKFLPQPLVYSYLNIFLTICLWLSVFPALRDNRIELVRATSSELTISISDVMLSDEGMYTCSLFTMPVRTAKAYLTVLGEYTIQSKSKNSTSKENVIDGCYSSSNVCKICSKVI